MDGFQHSPVPFAHLAFTNDGKTLLAVAEGRILLLDAFTGACVCVGYVACACALPLLTPLIMLPLP